MRSVDNSPDKLLTNKSSSLKSPINLNSTSTIKPYLDRIKFFESKSKKKYKILLQQNRTVMNA